MEKEKKEAGMQKKNFKDGIRLSPLGMGAMRLPQTEEGFAKPIDEPRLRRLSITASSMASIISIRPIFTTAASPKPFSERH